LEVLIFAFGWYFPREGNGEYAKNKAHAFLKTEIKRHGELAGGMTSKPLPDPQPVL